MFAKSLITATGQTQTAAINAMVVAGGGGGGFDGGGGGGGGVFVGSSFTVPAQAQISVIIGAGGVAQTFSDFRSGFSGADSSFFEILSNGGGGGGSYSRGATARLFL